MMEWWVLGVWLGKRFTTDEHVIGLENGEVVRTRNVRPKFLQDSWKFDDIDKSKGQSWDPNVTLRMKSWRRKDFQGSKILRQPRSHAQVAHDKESRLNQGWWMDAGMQEVYGHEGRLSVPNQLCPQRRLQSTRC